MWRGSEKLKDPKMVISSPKSKKDRQYINQGQTMMYKILHRKLQNEQLKTH